MTTPDEPPRPPPSGQAPMPTAPPRRRSGQHPALLEAPSAPVYLASQLASICDVDLKTIHNWCARDDPEEPAGLESFRTPGGHLRFQHDAVLRFLSRWGYPIPDELLQDRPHVLMVEPEVGARREAVRQLGLVRPGDERGVGGALLERVLAALKDPSPAATLGLWSTPEYYVHVWDDAYTALLSLGERAGAGAAPELTVLTVPLPGMDDATWIRTARAHLAGNEPRFVLVADVRAPLTTSTELGVVGVIDILRPETLGPMLNHQAAQLRALARLKPPKPSPVPTGPVTESPPAGDEAPRRRRVSIAPREPILVASQVATMWGVDLKTVHNWVEEGALEAFRTPGRHLRFRRRSLLSFLRRYNQPIPEALASPRPTVMVAHADPAVRARLVEQLSPSFQVVTEGNIIGALAALGEQCAGASLVDALVVALPSPGVDDPRWIRAVLSHPDTRYVRVLVLSQDDDRARRWQEAGAIATVRPGELGQLRALLEQVLCVPFSGTG